MSYELELTDVAAEDLQDLVKSLPADRRADAINGVETALLKLAANPLLASRQHLGRPTYHFQFAARGVRYHWGTTFCYSEDETRIRITHIYRASAF
jgi:plasmid stabilization system protein ParE